MLSREWRCSWSCADRPCSIYIWVINNFIAYWGVTYIRGLTVYALLGHEDLLLVIWKPSEIHSNEISFKSQTYSFKKIHLKLLSKKMVAILFIIQWVIVEECSMLSMWYICVWSSILVLICCKVPTWALAFELHASPPVCAGPHNVRTRDWILVHRQLWWKCTRITYPG